MSTTQPGTTMLRTETRLMLREPGAMFWTVLFPTILLCILSVVPGFRDPDKGVDGVPVLALYVPIGILLSAIMASIQSMPAVISSYRENDVLRRYSTTPAKPWQILAAQVAIHAAGITTGAALVVLTGWLAFGISLPGSPLAYLLVLVLAIVVNLATGALIASVAPSSRASATLGTIVFLPAMFTAGVYFPVAAMPGLLGQIVALTPNGAAGLALNAAAAGDLPGIGRVVVLVGWTLGLGALAARYFRWS